MFKTKILSLATIALLASLPFSSTQAAPAIALEPIPAIIDEIKPIVGLGQEDQSSPAKIRNLKLSDPLVQAKYLGNTDLIRFLRGTYAEACTRGMVVQAAKQIKSNISNTYDEKLRSSASQVLESNRIWKLTSLEMEMLFGTGYIQAANYCDCVMKEISSKDLVNPAKSIDVVEELPVTTRDTCERIAVEKTELYVKKYGIRNKKND